MASKHLRGDTNYAWPGAEIAVSTFVKGWDPVSFVLLTLLVQWEPKEQSRFSMVERM